MKVLDLFSGIGGFSLGLESTGGFETVGFCEIDPYWQDFLKAGWPGVLIGDDVKAISRLGVTRWSMRAFGYHDPLQGEIGGTIFDIPEPIDVVCGGFPCQDLSLAGNRAGLEGERSGLWSHLFRIITEVRPRWAIIENVPGLRTLGADRVLSELAGAGYAAWPLVVGAVHAGAPHRRQRVWIVAYSERTQRGQESGACGVSGEYGVFAREEGSGGTRGFMQTGDAPDTQGERPGEEGGFRRLQPKERIAGGGQTDDATDTNHQGLEVWKSQPGDARPQCKTLERGDEQWNWSRAPEPVLRGVDDGLPCGLHRTKRLKALGNSVVPQIVEEIGRAILKIESLTH